MGHGFSYSINLWYRRARNRTSKRSLGHCCHFAVSHVVNLRLRPLAPLLLPPLPRLRGLCRSFTHSCEPVALAVGYHRSPLPRLVEARETSLPIHHSSFAFSGLL